MTPKQKRPVLTSLNEDQQSPFCTCSSQTESNTGFYSLLDRWLKRKLQTKLYFYRFLETRKQPNRTEKLNLTHKKKQMTSSEVVPLSQQDFFGAVDGRRTMCASCSWCWHEVEQLWRGVSMVVAQHLGCSSTLSIK